MKDIAAHELKLSTGLEVLTQKGSLSRMHKHAVVILVVIVISKSDRNRLSP
jgi:hypothetical protein